MSRLLWSTILLLSCLKSYAINPDISGFITIGGTISDSAVNYDNNINNQLNLFRDSKVGINFRSDLSNKLSAAIQLLNYYDKFDDDFKLKADWAFVALKPSNNLAFDFGKQKLPAWLISDYYDVGLLYPWVRPPAEIYALTPISTFTGANVTSKFFIGNFLNEISIYAGKTPFTVTNNLLVDNATAALVLNAQLGTNCTAPCLIPGTITGTSQIQGVKAVISNDNILLRGNYTIAPQAKGSSNLGAINYKYQYKEIGTKIDFNNSFLMGEYVNSTVNNNQTGTKELKNKAFYATIGHNMGIFTPHLTWAHVTFERPIMKSGALSLASASKYEQDSLIAGLVTKTTDASDFKIEYQQISTSGTNGLFSTATQMTDDVQIISAAFDLVF